MNSDAHFAENLYLPYITIKKRKRKKGSQGILFSFHFVSFFLSIFLKLLLLLLLIVLSFQTRPFPSRLAMLIRGGEPGLGDW